MKLSRLIAALRAEAELAEDLAEASTAAQREASNVLIQEIRRAQFQGMTIQSLEVELPIALAEPGLLAEFRRERSRRRRPRGLLRRAVGGVGTLLRRLGERLAGVDRDELTPDVPDVNLRLESGKSPTTRLRLVLARRVARSAPLELVSAEELSGGGRR